MTKRTNRVAWGLAAALAIVVLGGAGVAWLRDLDSVFGMEEEVAQRVVSRYYQKVWMT